MMINKIIASVLLIHLFGFSVVSAQVEQKNPAPYNKMVLWAIEKMPKHGKYAVNRDAAIGLRNSMVYRGKKLVVNAKHAQPSYCSGATYLNFLYVVEEMQRQKKLKMSAGVIKTLLARGQADGSEVWGRWNANGPGTARFFHETGIGVNFEKYERALPGDYMKIFWSDEIGRKEFGHSVVYLGMKDVKGVPHVRFWSSNKPLGYGAKLVPKSKIKWAIFSRIKNLGGVMNTVKIPKSDPFLLSMLKLSYDKNTVRQRVGIPLNRESVLAK